MWCTLAGEVSPAGAFAFGAGPPSRLLPVMDDKTRIFDVREAQ